MLLPYYHAFVRLLFGQSFYLMTTEALSRIYKGELPRLVKQSTMDNYFRRLSSEEQETIRIQAERVINSDRQWYSSEEARAYRSRVQAEQRAL